MGVASCRWVRSLQTVKCHAACALGSTAAVSTSDQMFAEGSSACSTVQKSWAAPHVFRFCFQGVCLVIYFKKRYWLVLRVFWRSFKDCFLFGQWSFFTHFQLFIKPLNIDLWIIQAQRMSQCCVYSKQHLAKNLFWISFGTLLLSALCKSTQFIQASSAESIFLNAKDNAVW